MENINYEEYLSLVDIIKILRKKIIFIITITILCTGIMAVKVIFLTVPTYQAYTTAVIVKGDSNISKDSNYTQGDVLLYQKMVETYVQIAQSNLVIDKTAEDLKTYSPSQIRAMVSAAPSGETQIIQLKAVSSNKEDVANIANVYCKNFIEQSMSILPVGKIQVMDPANPPNSPISDNKFKNITFGFLFGLILSIGIVFFRYYLNSFKITNEKQIWNVLNLPVLVTME